MKRIFTLLIITLLLVSLALPAGASISTEDCKNLMTSLSLINEEEYKENEIITRGEFANILTRFWNMSANDTKVDLETLFQFGIAGKDKSGNLREDDPLTYDEAIFSILSLADYSVVADSAGGYPNGYRAVAIKYGLTCSKKATQSITWDDVSALLYKMMYLPKMEITHGNDPQYIQLKDETIMYSMFGLVEVKGKLNAYGDIDLNNGEPLDKDQVKIGTQCYFTSLDCESMIGKYVTAFYREDGSTREALFIYEDDKNNVMKLSSDKELEYNGSYYTYREDNKKKKVSLETRVSVLYNGRVPQRASEMTFEPSDGYIEFIDNNGNNKYDVVKIYNSDVYLINTIETTEEGTIIYADGKPSVKIITDEEQSNTKIYAGDGSKTRLSKMKVGDVVTVYAYMKNNELVAESINFTKEIFEGVLVSFSKDDRTIEIDKTTYKYHSSTETAFESALLGNYRRYAVDGENKIVFLFDESLTEKNKGIGYILLSEQTSGRSRGLEIKLFDSNGNMRYLKTGKKVYVDGVVKKTNEEIIAALIDRTGLVSYILNNDETLRSVDFAETVTYDDNTSIDPLNHFTLIEGTLNAGGEKLYWRSSIRALGDKSFCSDDAKLFILPADETLIDNKSPEDSDAEETLKGNKWPVDSDADDNEYIVCNPSEFFSDTASYTVKTYSFNGSHLIDFIVLVQSKSDAISSSKGISVIKKIKYVVRDDGTVTARLQMLGEKGSEDLLCADMEVFNGCSNGSATVIPEEGDIVTYRTNFKGEIHNIRMVYDKSSPSPGNFTPSNDTDKTFGKYTSIYAIEKGCVFDKRNDILLVTRKDLSKSLEDLKLTSDDFEATLISKSTIIKVNKYNEVTSGNAGDIKSYKTHSGEFSTVITGGQANLRTTIVIYED